MLAPTFNVIHLAFGARTTLSLEQFYRLRQFSSIFYDNQNLKFSAGPSNLSVFCFSKRYGLSSFPFLNPAEFGTGIRV